MNILHAYFLDSGSESRDCTDRTISFPEAATILLVSDGDHDLWLAGQV